MRRAFTVLLLLAVAAAAVWTLLRWNITDSVQADPWNAMPERSAVIIEVPDAWTTWDRFTHTSQLWGAFENDPHVAAVGRLMGRSVARMENDAALRTALENVSLLISITRTGGETVDLLIACVPKSANGVPVQAFGELLNADVATMNALGEGGVVQVRPDPALPELSLALADGLWLLATSPAMMDEAQMQLRNGSAKKDPLLAEARNTLGAGSDAHVLVHMERGRSLLETWYTPTALEAYDLPHGWLALDLRARPDAFLLSGLLLPDGAHAMLNTIAHQGSGRTDLARWLPSEVAYWDVQHVENAEEFLKDRGAVNDSDRTNLGPDLFHWVHGNIGTARSAAVEGSAPVQWALFKTDDAGRATDMLLARCPNGCDTLSYRGTRLAQLPVAHAYERLLGSSYDFLERPWWCALGDVVVMASGPEALRTSIDAWNDGHTLAEDARTSEWTQRIASTAGRTTRWDVARNWRAFGNGMRDAQRAGLVAQDTILNQLGGLSVQVSPAQHGHLNVAIALQFAPLEERSTNVVWNTALKAAVQRKPDIVRNHNNNSREVLVQDIEHRLYLVSSTGRILWTRDLESPILGAVQQVDRFRNGKLQLLFNTAGRIHLIDRNGKDVGGFPVALTSPATAAIAVFDYDSERDYRIVVPTADGKVLNYGLDGAKVKGWDPPKLATSATNCAQHVRIRNKDYIVVVDGEGAVQLLDRRGSDRERSTLALGHAPVIRTIVPGLDLMSTRILWADSSGALYQGRLDGTKTALSVGRGTVYLGPASEDGSFDLIRLVGDSILLTHGQTTTLLRTFGVTILPDLNLYQLGGGSAFGLVLPERELVTLLDRGGLEMRGMPVQGASPFSIADLDLDGDLELVTVTKDGHLIAYRTHNSEK